MSGHADPHGPDLPDPPDLPDGRDLPDLPDLPVPDLPVPSPVAVMTDVEAVVLAGAAALGALVAVALPLPVGVVVAALALVLKRPRLLWVGVALLASTMAARAEAGVVPLAPAPFSGSVTLTADPLDVEGGVRVEARLRTDAGRRRVDVWARGPAARGLRTALAGERVHLEGRLGPVPQRFRRRLASRHLAGQLQVVSAGPTDPGSPAARTANGLRRTLVRGASSLSWDQRALFTGLVFGDDRAQSPEVRDDFRAAGLTHLLAVSGQNVAFVLALAAPGLRRLRLWPRFLVVLVVLVAFGTVTRWEPSVVRAVAMAALATLAASLGRPVSPMRLLALAVAAVLLIDPLLVGVAGFLLSVGACTGIALLSAPLERRLPGPEPLRAALAVTLAAQVGVAPVLVPLFGGVPVASVPANLLAGPAAGPLMGWGLVAGLPAGVVGGWVAGLLHLPTGVLVGWIAWVARWSAALPLGSIGLVHLAVLAATVVLSLTLRRPVRAGRRSNQLRFGRLGVLVAVGSVVVAPAVDLALVSRRPVWDGAVADGARLWRADEGTVLVVDTPQAGALLAGLRRSGVGRLDVVVARRAGSRASRSLRPLLARHRPRLLLTPAGSELPGATHATSGTRSTAGGLAVDVVRTEPRLEVVVLAAPVPATLEPRPP